MLTGVMEIDSGMMKTLFKHTIETGGNMLVLGPSGVGKTEMGQQAIAEAGLEQVYLNLSVLETPDFVGLPKYSENGTTTYAPPPFMPLERLQPRDKDGNITSKKVVLLIDEADKAKPDLQAPLLEILKDRTLNGEKLHVQACLLTGNLPDEGAFSLPMSHAVTNRCKVFRVGLSHQAWMEWAQKNGVHPLVIGYLNRSPDKLLQPPAEGDPTAYARPSPRAWVAASRDLQAADHESVEFMHTLVAGHVGTAAAADFRVWLTHYRELDPAVDALIKSGKEPEALSVDKTFIFAISAANRLCRMARDEELKDGAVQKAGRNVFGWVRTIPPEFQFAVIKSADLDALSGRRFLSQNPKTGKPYVPEFDECVTAVGKILGY